MRKAGHARPGTPSEKVRLCRKTGIMICCSLSCSKSKLGLHQPQGPRWDLTQQQQHTWPSVCLPSPCHRMANDVEEVQYLIELQKKNSDVNKWWRHLGFEIKIQKRERNIKEKLRWNEFGIENLSNTTRKLKGRSYWPNESSRRLNMSTQTYSRGTRPNKEYKKLKSQESNIQRY